MNDEWIPINEIWKEKAPILHVLVYTPKRGMECASKLWNDRLHSDSGADLTGKATHYMYLPKLPLFLKETKKP